MADEEKKLDIRIKALEKYAEPKTIKEFYVNRLFDISQAELDKANASKNPTDIYAHADIYESLRDQAEYSIANNGRAVLKDDTSTLLENILRTRGPEATKKLAELALDSMIKEMATQVKAPLQGEVINGTYSALNGAIDDKLKLLAISTDKPKPAEVSAANLPHPEKTELASLTK